MAGESPATSTSLDTLRRAIGSKTATVGIVGLGYVGLPLARVFVEAGFTTMGFDVDSQKVACLRTGESYIKHRATSCCQS